jgi:hypothetical protein
MDPTTFQAIYDELRPSASSLSRLPSVRDVVDRASLHAGSMSPAVKKEINAVIKQHLDRHLLL